jgi:Zn-dependent protease with chaperone function
VERAQRSLPAAAASLLALVLLAGAFYRWGLPWVAVKTADHVSPELAGLLATQTLELLDDHLKSSTLDADRQQQLRTRARALGDGEALLFRHGGVLGANALTLPAGRIVLLDELVALADNDEQILAVLGHELGHAAGRHGLRLLVRNTLVGAFTAWWFGDVSQLLVIGPTLLLNTEYSRTLEQEADAHAIALLKAQGISPLRLAEMLRKLEAAHGRPARATRAGCVISPPTPTPRRASPTSKPRQATRGRPPRRHRQVYPLSLS